jgi:type IV pilus assembly protein PilM
MGLFRRKKETVSGLVGLDIGAGGVKIVELVRKDKKLTLSTYASARPKEMKDGQTVHDFFKNTKEAANMLQSLLKAAGVQQKKVNVAIPSHVVFHAMITLPVPTKPNEDLRPQVEARVKPLLPLPIEEMVIDSVVVDKHLLPKAALSLHKKDKDTEEDSAIAQFAALQSGEGMAAAGVKPAFIRVLVSGSPKALVDQYVDIAKRANVELVALETESFALIRSLIGNDKAKIMIVDIGEDRTNLTIVQQGLPFLHRSIQVGGGSMTKEFMRRLNVDHATAEQIKRDLAQDPDGEPPEAITAILEPILHEIQYSLKLFAEQDFHNQTTVDKIILAGGSAHIPYLDPILTKAIKVNVYVGNPWARVMTPPQMRQVLDANGPEFAVAIGLAMKE